MTVEALSSKNYTITPTQSGGVGYTLSGATATCNNATASLNTSTGTLTISNPTKATTCTVTITDKYTCSVGNATKSGTGYICTASASTQKWYTTNRYDCNCTRERECETYDCSYSRWVKDDDGSPDDGPNWHDEWVEKTCRDCYTYTSCSTCTDYTYQCPSGWNTYSGSGSTLVCSKAATH